MLRQELSNNVVEGLQERYQFTWPDKKKAMLAANAPINKTLRPCREESVDFDNTSFDYGTKALHHKINRHGNIGVTTSQQMIESERKLAKINILEMVISDLKSLMLLNVY